MIPKKRCKAPVCRLLLVFALSLLTTGLTMANDLVSEVRAIRTKDRRTEIDITPSVVKFIPIGTAKPQAQAYLEALGFKTYPHRAMPDGRERLLFSKDEARMLIFRDEIRVILTFAENKTTAAWGALFFHSL